MSFGDRYWETVALGPFNSDGDETRAVARVSGKAIVKSIDVFNTTATHATNYITYTLVNLGTDASGTTVIATASTSQTGGSAIAAHVAFPLTITAANAAVAAGDTLGFVRDEANTNAAALAACTVVVKYQNIGPMS